MSVVYSHLFNFSSHIHNAALIAVPMIKKTSLRFIHFGIYSISFIPRLGKHVPQRIYPEAPTLLWDQFWQCIHSYRSTKSIKYRAYYWIKSWHNRKVISWWNLDGIFMVCLLLSHPCGFMFIMKCLSFICAFVFYFPGEIPMLMGDFVFWIFLFLKM